MRPVYPKKESQYLAAEPIGPFTQKLCKGRCKTLRFMPRDDDECGFCLAEKRLENAFGRSA